jgi:hypothetical protein
MKLKTILTFIDERDLFSGSSKGKFSDYSSNVTLSNYLFNVFWAILQITISFLLNVRLYNELIVPLLLSR